VHSHSFAEALQRTVKERAPQALTLFAALSLLGASFEVFTFTGRTSTLLAVDLLFAAVVGVGFWRIRRRPEQSVEVMAACVAVAGMGIAIYHGFEGASAEACLLVMTALLSSVTLFFPWGWRMQLVASSGVAVGFPLALLNMPQAMSTVANLSFLVCVVALSCYGAELNLRQLSKDHDLAQALRKREARLRSYLDQALIGVGVLDRDGRWIEANEALAKIVGYERREFLTGGWRDIVDPSEGEAGSSIAALCEECSVSGTVDRRLRAKDGGLVYACIGGRSFHDDEGRLEEALFMVLDVSGRKRSEVELQMAKDIAEAAYRSKSEFLAHMSHELRTPMNVIFGMTEMALDSPVTGEQRDFLQKTRVAARDLLVLVDEVLDLSRIEAGRLHLTEREFGLRRWLAQTIEPLSLLAREKGLELSWHVAPELPERTIGDPDRLRQVLVNLIANAIKFTHAGHVRIEVTRSASNGGAFELRFTVEDTGVGIPVEQRSRIFEAFVQGDGSDGGRPHIGTGLGLTICSRLVDLMGGRIWLDSEVGRGSSFRFTALVSDPRSHGTSVPS
jgi:PAS domain S-box-containing protein